MKRFAKIFDLPDHQVLIAKDFPDEGDEGQEGQIVVTTFIEGVKSMMRFGYNSLEKRDQDFEQYDAAAAQHFVKSMLEAFTGSPSEG